MSSIVGGCFFFSLYLGSLTGLRWSSRHSSSLRRISHCSLCVPLCLFLGFSELWEEEAGQVSGGLPISTTAHMRAPQGGLKRQKPKQHL